VGSGERRHGHAEEPVPVGVAAELAASVFSVEAARRSPSEWQRLLRGGEEPIRVRSPDGDVLALISEV
jgi:hypothetical protein